MRAKNQEKGERHAVSEMPFQGRPVQVQAVYAELQGPGNIMPSVRLLGGNALSNEEKEECCWPGKGAEGIKKFMFLR